MPGRRRGPPGARSPVTWRSRRGGRVPGSSSPGNGSEAGGKVSGRPPPHLLLRRGERELSGNRLGHAGAPGLGRGAAGASVQAVSCAPGERAAAEPGRGGVGGTPGSRGAQDVPGRPSLPSSVFWLDRALGCAGHQGWGDVLAGCLAPWGLECRGGARVAKLPGELELGRSCRPLWAGSEGSVPAGCGSRMHADFLPWWCWGRGVDLGNGRTLRVYWCQLREGSCQD